MSKSTLIDSIETQILKGQSYLFQQYKAELIGKGVSANDQIIKTIDTLTNQTVESVKSKIAKLDEKYCKKLKILSILSQFYGRNTYSVGKLASALLVSRQECLQLLIEASISKLVEVKINEQSGEILIRKSKIRQRQINDKANKLSGVKIARVIDKNNQVQKDLDKLIGSLDKK